MLYVWILVATVVGILVYNHRKDDKEVSEPTEWSAVAYTDLRSTYKKRYTGFYDPKVKNN